MQPKVLGLSQNYTKSVDPKILTV